MKNGTATGSKFLITAIAALVLATSSTFAGSLIGFFPGGGDNIQPNPIGGGGSGDNISSANTENDYTGSTTGAVGTGTNWALGHVPTSSEDATFTTGTGIRTMSATNLAFGTLNVTATSGTFSIRNDTSGASNSILTLGGAGDDSVTGSAAGDILFANTGATLQLLGVNGGGGTGVLQVALAESGNFDAAGTIVVSSVISDGGNNFSISKTGAGILTLSGANTYGGGLTLSAGTLRFNNAAAAGTGTFTVNGGSITNTSGAAITATNAVTVGGDFTFIGTSSPATSNLTLSGPVTLTGNRSIVVSGTTSTLTISGAIGDGGSGFSLTKAAGGVGTLILGGANTYSGGTTIAAGTLSVTAGGSLGTGNVSLTAGSVTLTLAGASQIASTATLSYLNTDIINLNYSGTTTINGLTVDGVAQAAGVYGAGFLNPDNAFTGTGTITVVPEPATLAMMGLGTGLLLGVQRFRRKLR
jgi:fibronectin-binding autotransporter adhesin